MISKMTNELWKIIADFPDYAVSNMGRVKRITGGTGASPGRILKQHSSARGYFQAGLYRNRKMKNCLVHRVVLLTFIGEDQERKEANHINGNKHDNRLSNLEWVTRSENEKHAYKNGLKNMGVGDECHNSRLKSGEVWLIKRLISFDSVSQSIMAKMFKVSRENISAIKRNKSWKSVEYP